MVGTGRWFLSRSPITRISIMAFTAAGELARTLWKIGIGIRPQPLTRGAKAGRLRIPAQGPGPTTTCCLYPP